MDCAVALAAHGAKLDLTDEDGRTALHVAVDKGQNAIVRALLAFDADTTIKDKVKYTVFETRAVLT